MSSPAPRLETVTSIDYPIEDFTWRFKTSHADEIEAHWTKARAATPGLFNGRVMLMRDERIEAGPEGPVLRGTSFETDYKTFLAWRAFGFPDASITNSFAMAALRSADGAFILGRMGMHTAAPGRVYFPSGTPDLDDVRDGRVDLTNSALRELVEETGIKAEDVSVAPGWTLVFDRRYLACMKQVRSKETAAVLVARCAEFLARDKEPELTGLVPVFSEADFDPAHMPPFMIDYMRQTL